MVDFSDVPCGVWQLTAKREGFNDNTVNVNMTGLPLTQVSLALEPVSVHSSLDVTDKAPGIEQTASVSNELTPSVVKPHVCRRRALSEVNVRGEAPDPATCVDGPNPNPQQYAA